MSNGLYQLPVNIHWTVTEEIKDLWPSNRPSRSLTKVKISRTQETQFKKETMQRLREVAHTLLGPCPTSLTIKWTLSSTGKVGVKLGQSLRPYIKKLHTKKRSHLVWPTILFKNYFLNFLIEFTQQFIVQISS